MSDSQIKTSDLDRGVTRVHLVGEVDIATAERLQRALDDLIRDGQLIGYWRRLRGKDGFDVTARPRTALV